MKRMFHQKVNEITFIPKFLNRSDFVSILGYTVDQSKIIKSIGEFIYDTDNIYLITTIRKLYNYHCKLYEDDNLGYYVKVLNELEEKKLVNVKIFKESEEDLIYSTIEISPLLMFMYYQRYIENFETLLKAIVFEIKEKDNKDSYKIAQNVKVKLVVVNNILDYMKNMGILHLMRYSGTPLPGGKSFIILKKDLEGIESFINENSNKV